MTGNTALYGSVVVATSRSSFTRTLSTWTDSHSTGYSGLSWKYSCKSGYLEFHSTFCLSLRLRKLGLMRIDIQGLTLWKSHWKVRKLVTEMVRMSWLNGSMATQLHCKTKKRLCDLKKTKSRDLKSPDGLWPIIKACVFAICDLWQQLEREHLLNMPCK